MSRWMIVFCVLLAGCSGPTESVDDTDPVADDFSALRDAFEPTTVIFGEYDWHRFDGPGANEALEQVEYVGQTVVPGCLDPQTGEPDGWNLRLQATRGVPNGTRALEVTFTWDSTAYIRDELVLAYKPADGDWLLSEYIANGETAEIEVDPASWDPDETAWGYAACLVREEHRNLDSGAAWRPGGFSGTLKVQIDAVA